MNFVEGGEREPETLNAAICIYIFLDKYFFYFLINRFFLRGTYIACRLMTAANPF